VVAFGDLFLEDVRAYREERLARVGKQAHFPLWGSDTHALAREFLAAGFAAVVCCADPRAVDGRLAGRAYDEELLAGLPEGVDPCGERGEFHTFVSAGPVLRRAVGYRRGRVVERDGFVFCDLVPA
jgi:diphthamide synthase (EF-2-diphthine--ammonia ligase)